MPPTQKPEGPEADPAELTPAAGGAPRLDMATPSDPTTSDATYVVRRGDASGERGLVVGYPDREPWALIAWGEAANKTPQYAAAEAVREDTAGLERWQPPYLENGLCRHDGRPIARRTDRPRAQWFHADIRGGRVCAGGQTAAEPATAPEGVDALKPRPGEPVTVSLARVAGWGAYRAGESAAPALNPMIMAMIPADTPVGEPMTLAIFRAFAEGFDLAAEQAAQAVLAAPAEHVHTLAGGCPVTECPWPLESNAAGSDLDRQAARMAAWGAYGMGHALPPAAVDGPAGPGQL